MMSREPKSMRSTEKIEKEKVTECVIRLVASTTESTNRVTA